jgi:hypothetical protein
MGLSLNKGFQRITLGQEEMNSIRSAALALIAAIPVITIADERPYAFTYEPVVSAAGEVEVEAYETLYQPRQGGSGAREWVHQLELGYGLTDQLTLSAYGVFRTTADHAVEPAAVRLEGRYKMLGSDAPVDLVLYAEVEKEVVDDKPWAIEEKLILGRNHGRLSWALNLIAEQEFPAAGGRELKLGWSAGVAAEPARGLRLGVESFGWRTRGVDGAVEWTAWAGPTGSVALPFLARGPLNSAWLIVGAGLGLNDASDRVRARAVLGCDF